MTTILALDAVHRNFLVAHYDWPVTTTLALIDRYRPSHVVVEGQTQGQRYLFRRDQIRTQLDRWRGEPLTLAAGLGLGSMAVAATLGAYDRADGAPLLAVVVDGQRIAGVYDPRSREPHGAVRGAEGDVTLSISVAQALAVGAEGALLVSVRRQSETGDTPLPIDLVLSTSAGLGVVDAPMLSVALGPSGPPPQVLFKLRGSIPGPGRIRVDAFHRGYQVGDLSAQIEVVTGALNGVPTLRRSNAIQAGSAQQPDLTLCIFEHRIDTRQVELELRATSASLGLDFAAHHIPLFDHSAAVGRLFDAIARLDCGQGARRVAEEGAYLYQKLFPPALGALLQAHPDRVRSVLIQSQEPSIPWELCLLPGAGEEPGFLCEAFAVTRWPLGAKRQPTLRLRKIGLVVQPGAGLGYAQAEQRNLLGLQSGEREVHLITPGLDGLLDTLTAGGYDGLHFVAHNHFDPAVPDRSRIELGGGDYMTPINLYGLPERLRRASPLVFLNGCSTARSERGFSGHGGWASAFLNVGVAAFIGAQWDIDDGAAHSFAAEFYRHLLAGATVGEAARQARLALRVTAPDNPTRLAYTVFADPHARILPPDGATITP